MRRAALVCLTILLCGPVAAPAEQAPESWQKNGRVEWRTMGRLALPSSPLDVVSSADGRRVYCLTEDHKVVVFSVAGASLGVISVPAGSRALSVSPTGEALFIADAEGKQLTALELSYVVDINSTGAPALGPDKAPVEVVVFTDFECPHCAKAAPLLEEIHKKNPKQVRVVFKNMPLKFHRFAEPAALAALAAHMQGKFWPMHDQLFGGGKLDLKRIEESAYKAGLDMDRFNRDWKDQGVRQRLAQDLHDAQEAGVNSTPTLMVNGRTVHKRSLEEIQRLIDEELAAPKP
ncbi:MAG: hypothetical protein BWK76_09720 [Desulfobulbaceae bacterium A2]|nr:MAG: hypothetical protein BWK76_09720 [Desulfobulbaceae bacterium A2]